MRRLPRLISCAVLVYALLVAGSVATAQLEVILCLPPEVPMSALSEATLAQYRSEIAAEFEAYFADVSDYIAGLDTERGRAFEEAREAAGAYSTFLDTTPVQKDLP